MSKQQYVWVCFTRVMKNCQVTEKTTNSARLKQTNKGQSQGLFLTGCVKDENGRLCTRPSDINQAFTSFYSTLYSSETRVESHDMAGFLNSLNLSSLSPTQSRQLDAPITSVALKKGGSPHTHTRTSSCSLFIFVHVRLEPPLLCLMSRY